MIVCKCFGITEQQVRDGHAGLAGTDCGSCLPLLKELKALTAVEFVTANPFEFALGTLDNTVLGLRVEDNQLVIFARDDSEDYPPVSVCCFEHALSQLVGNCVRILLASHEPTECNIGWEMLTQLRDYRELAEPIRSLAPDGVVFH